MNRFAAISSFQCHSSSESGRMGRIMFMPFWLIGFPTIEVSLDAIRVLAACGSDALELGLPFSDPIADGPVLQQAATRALKEGFSLSEAWRVINIIRSEFPMLPLSLMVYANLVHHAGIECFAKNAVETGLDAILIPDLPLGECEAWFEIFRKVGLGTSLIVTSGTSDDRIRSIDETVNTYLYAVSVAGVTGMRTHFDESTLSFVRRLKKLCKHPVFVGFGISNQFQVKQLSEAKADGFIVGSYFAQLLERAEKCGENFIDVLKKALPNFLE